MFVDYEYYIESFAGSLVPAEDFPRLEFTAERLLSYITQRKYLSVADEGVISSIKNAICGAVEAAHDLTEPYADIPTGIASETTDGHSVSFASVDRSKLKKQCEKLMYDVFAQELYYTGLLYQGVS